MIHNNLKQKEELEKKIEIYLEEVKYNLPRELVGEVIYNYFLKYGRTQFLSDILKRTDYLQ